VRLRKRPSIYALLAPPPHLFGYVIAPIALSRFGTRHGWRGGRPGQLNRLGLLPLAGGAATVGWAITSHYQAAPEEAEVTLIPGYLVRGGAYARSRNPMYVGGATMLVGWSWLFGSLRLGAVALTYMLALDRLGIPFEERILTKKFGESYESYRRQVPRWL
jgi:Phospholipid methyltransferase